MKKSRMILSILFVFILSAQTSCSSSGAATNDSGSSKAASGNDSLDSELDSGADSASSDSGQSAQKAAASEDQELEDSLAENPTPPPENLEDPTKLGDTDQTPPAIEAPAESATAPQQTAGGTTSSETVTVTGLDFKANDNGGTIVIKTSAPTSYTTRAVPEKNQFVIEVQNAILPKKFQRPYNTKEFSSAIGLINGYQNKGSKTARIVVQLREPIEPSVQQEGNSILVMALGGGTAVAEDGAAAPTETATTAEPAPTEAATSDFDDRILKGRTLDDFLTGTMKFYGRPISLQVKDGDLRDVFNFISEESGLNLVLTDEVTGKVSVKLKEIPWDQALVVVMQSKQLGYIRQGNILRVAPLKAIRAETDATKDVIESQKGLQPLKVKVFPVSYAQAKDLEPQVQGFLSTRGKVRADTRTNALVVNDISEVISKIEKLLKALDTQTPQVMIEGKIVEARETFAQSIGVTWGAGPKDARSTLGFSENYASMDAGSTTSALTIGPLVGQLFDWTNVAAKLQLYEKESKIKVLSSPRIVTLNNIKATIEQTTEVPLVTVTTSTTGVSRSVTYKSAKLQLGVTPQITSDGGVILSVNVMREFFGKDVFDETEARPLNSRQASTTVLVNNGDTAVIGGIYQNDATETETGIPFLRKIPLLGNLFKGQTQDMEKNELLIFLSPRVLNVEKAFGGAEQPAAQTAEPEPETESL